MRLQFFTLEAAGLARAKTRREIDNHLGFDLTAA
jgi:hypothetical protein